MVNCYSICVVALFCVLNNVDTDGSSLVPNYCVHKLQRAETDHRLCKLNVRPVWSVSSLTSQRHYTCGLY